MSPTRADNNNRLAGRSRGGNITVTLYPGWWALFGGLMLPLTLNGYPIKAVSSLRKLALTQELPSLPIPTKFYTQASNPKISYRQTMPTPGLSQIWSLSVPLTGELPRAPKFDIWVVNAIIRTRVFANGIAVQLNAIPGTEIRLRNEGMAPLYSFLRKLIDTLKSSARERGVIVPAFPDALADWSEEASTDYKALATLLRPHMTEPVRAAMDWDFGMRDQNPKLHWASAPAGNFVTADLFIPLMVQLDGVLEGREWRPFKAMMAGDELKWIARVMGEELLRIRAQPGSGWNEEEAKEMAKGRLKSAAGFIEAGT